MGLVGRALDPAGGARLLERHIAHAAAGRHLRLVARAVRARQAVGRHHQFGGRIGARAAVQVVAAAQQHDLVPGVVARTRADHAARHQAADQHRIAAEGRRIDQRRAQAAVQARLAEGAVQRIAQGGNRHPGTQGRAIGGVACRQLIVGKREIPLAVLVQRVALRARLRPQLVGALIAGKSIVAQAAQQDVGARAADQRQVATVVRAVQRDAGGGVIGAARRCRGVDGAIVLQGHGVHAAQGHRACGARARRHVRQRGRGLVATERGVAFHARDVFGCAACGQVADHQIVPAAAADAVLSAAVGHGDDVVAQAADDVVAIVATRADDVADVQHARQAAGVVEAGIAVLEVQVDGDVVFIARVIQRRPARHAEEHLYIEVVDQRGREAVDAAVGRHARAHEDADASAGLHAGRDISTELGEVQCVAALAGLLGQGETEGAARGDVGVAAAAALDDVLRVIDRDRGVAHHRDSVAALRGTLDSADRAHIAESGRRRRRNFFAVGVRRGAGQIDRHAGRIAAVVQYGLAALRRADQVEGLVPDLQALRTVGRLEHHVDDALGPVVAGIHRRIRDLVGVVAADDGRDIAPDAREIQRVIAIVVVFVAYPDAILQLHSLAHFDRRQRRGGIVVEHECVIAAVADQMVIDRHALQGGTAALQTGGAGHHAVPAGDRHRVGVDHAAAVIQHPIAAQRGAAHGMRGRRHVGARDGRQAVHESDARAARSDIAAIEQDVAIIRQGVAPGAQLVLVGVQLAGAQRGSAQRQRSDAAVAHDLHCGQVPMLAQDLRDLVHAVVAAVQHDDLRVVAAQHLQLRAVAGGPCQPVQAFGLAADQAIQALYDLLGVVHRRIHEDDLAHRRLFGVRGVAGDVGGHRGRPGLSRFLAWQPGLGIALARGVGLGVLLQRQHLAVLGSGLEGSPLHQVGMRAGRAGRLALGAGGRTAGPGMGRRHHRSLVAGGRRRRHQQFGRHEIAALQRLEERPPAKQGLLHLAGGTAGPEFARQFLHAHIVARHFLCGRMQRPDLNDSEPSGATPDGPVVVLPAYRRACAWRRKPVLPYSICWLIAAMSAAFSVPAACLSFRPSSRKL